MSSIVIRRAAGSAIAALAIAIVLASPGLAAAAPGWTAVASLPSPRLAHTATLLPNGKVLVAGGVFKDSAIANADLFDPAIGIWTSAEKLLADRCAHTATLLLNGKVLVVGGVSAAGILASAEIFDPESGSWAPTGSLVTARQGHTATLLQDGKVLVVGGSTGTNFAADAEIFDPESGSWSPGGSLAEARGRHTATLLADGRVLVAGGWGPGGPMAGAEIFDPASGKWEPTGKLLGEHAYHTATLLPDGTVLVAGGDNTVGPSVVAELYDPNKGKWSATKELSKPRDSHTATLLANGTVLVTGATFALAAATAEIYDPATGDWTTVPDLSGDRAYHTATLLPSGKVLVLGGRDSTFSELAGADVYDSATATSTATGGMASARQIQSATLLLDGRVLVAGGFDGLSGVIAPAEIYSPGTGVWSPAGSLAVPRYAHTATLLLSGKVVVAGGFQLLASVPYSSASAEVFDPATGAWTETGSLGAARRFHTATPLQDGTVVALGGNGNAGLPRFGERYDPAAGGWSPNGVLTVPRWSHTATLLEDGRILVAGGYSTVTLTSAEIFDPVAGSSTITGSLATARGNHTATRLANGMVLVAGGKRGLTYLSSAETYDPATGAWTPAGTLAEARSYHTATLLPNGTVLVTGGDGGSGYLATMEIYDPATNSWSPGGVLTTARAGHSATWLANGRLLLEGGSNTSDPLASAEIYNAGLGFDPARQPVLDAPPATFKLLDPPILAGGQFRGGWMEASGGGTASSATNYPLVQLRRLDNEQLTWLRPASFSDTSFTAAPVTGLPPGFAMITAFVNGIPSQSRIVYLTNAPAPSISSVDPSSGSVFGGSVVVLTGTGFEKLFTTLTFGGAAPTLLEVLNATELLAFTPAGTAGPADIVLTTLGGSATLTGGFTYVKATPVITWTNPAAIVVGTPLAGTQLNAAADVPGSFVYTPAAGTILGPGLAQSLFADFYPTDTAHYTPAGLGVTIDVLSPPVMVAQPGNQTVGNGALATFAATADGPPAPTVRWQVSTPRPGVWLDIAGATSSPLTFTAALADSGKQYRAVFTNSLGSATSSPATLTVVSSPAPPVITTQPVGQTVVVGGMATFVAAAVGGPTPSVKWQVGTAGGGNTGTSDGITWSYIAGASATAYSFTAALVDNGKLYRAVFTNASGAATSLAGMLTVVAGAGTAPVVTLSPSNQSASAGAMVSFTAEASGNPVPTVQWQTGPLRGTWYSIPGATGTTFSFAVTASDNGRQYRAVFTNPSGAATTAAATLTVTGASVPWKKDSNASRWLVESYARKTPPPRR